MKRITRRGGAVPGTLKKSFGLMAALLLLIVAAAPVMAHDPEPGAIERTWARTDKPVADGVVERTWMWGPDAASEAIMEPYAESPGGERLVQYYDKARMEINNPDAMDDGLWYVTNGLLVVELMTGMLQVGDDSFEAREPAMVNIAGDPGFAETPTYATFAGLMDAPAYAAGTVITATVDGQGNVGNADSQEAFNVTAGEMAPNTGHRTASVFWDFMVSSGPVYEGGQIVNGRLFQNPYYATGLPITEAYWSLIMVDGTEKWVLTQAFERRVLTYTPDNNAGFQVEAGNVGMHYWQWRYEMAPPPAGEADDQVYTAYLTPDAETMEVTSNADGDAIFFINADGQMEFEIIVVDIQDVTAAHIHLGMPGEDGPVVATLFMGEFSTNDVGVLANGTIAAGDLQGDLEGSSLGTLIAEIEAGNAYVNVHTTSNPGGEIRGQLVPVPEPGVFGLLGMTGFALLRHRSRRTV